MNRFVKKLFPVIVTIVFLAVSSAFAWGGEHSPSTVTFQIQNEKVSLTVAVDHDGKLLYEDVGAQPGWTKQYDVNAFDIKNDADFLLNIMWTNWSAPGKIENADNVVRFTRNDFALSDHKMQTLASGAKELDLTFKGTDNPLEVEVSYRIDPGNFYIRKKLSVRNPSAHGKTAGHFLRWIWPVHGNLLTDMKIIKKGGFGQPVAVGSMPQETGAFFGMEYPTSENEAAETPTGIKLDCGQVMGRRISDQWTESEWVVEGLTPEPDVKQWFMKYVNDIRVAPLRPYLLYNSWYDLEAPQMVTDPKRVMNEKNALHTIQSFYQRLTVERGLKLNAFVFDDGWDTYRSDWQLSKKQFPHGLKPIVNALAKTDTKLGLWFGPIGGYSHRDWRVDWMRAHGYETVGDEMCIAGTNYHKMFKKRVDDFVDNDQVGYYKWDGIQFSCSEPDHGHHIGIYSRHDIMESVIDLTKSVRSQNPDVFLNITSGTWLSPWWVKYANTIWMQGSDYGYTNIPSISQRDRAITYRDYTLYNDFKTNDFWFPISNLMTHGIIKGWLQQLGGVSEPLDKFTDNALLYLSRGVSMWELYISPDLLSDPEWDVLAQDIKWAKANFDVLQHTVMIGGNPGKGETYGYAHFNGEKGIVAVRNPGIVQRDLDFQLSHSLGLDKDADSLVVDQVYPSRWISPRLYSTGETLDLALNGYETAIYEIYPVKAAQTPLLAGAEFSMKQDSAGTYAVSVLALAPHQGGAHLLNPVIVKKATLDGKDINPAELSIPARTQPASVHDIVMTKQTDNGKGTTIEITMNVDSSMASATLAALLQSNTEGGKIPAPSVTIIDNGMKDSVSVENQEGRWGWYKVPVGKGMNKISINVAPGKSGIKWTGSADIWLIGRQKVAAHAVTLETGNGNQSGRVLPLVISNGGTVQTQYRIGTADLTVK